MRVGDISNNGTSDVDYATSITQHTTAGGLGAFRNGATTSTYFADFDQSYDPINGLNYEGAGTRYTVQAGDTLETIAQNLWGDAAFWYLIADVNGLDGSEALDPGMSLIIPNKVHNSHNNSDTYKVYDPNEAIGDTMPTAAKPPKKAKCGTFGMIMMVAIAVAVTVMTSGAAAAAAASATTGTSVGLGAGITMAIGGTTAAGLSLTTAGLATFGALGAAVGSIASQGFGMAAGIQDKFSWKGVALSALAGGIGGGLGASGMLKAASPLVQGAARGVLGNALTQGIGAATGLQSKFNWVGVATAGIGGGVGSALGGGNMWGRAASGMAGGIAAAAGESLLTGNSFGDTLMSSLPSIIGNTIGNMAADAVASGGRGGASGGGKQNNPSVADNANVGGNAAAGEVIINKASATEVAAKLHTDFLLELSGGDVALAKSMLIGEYAPSSAAIGAELSQETFQFSGGTYDSTTGTGTLTNAPIRDSLQDDGRIGHYEKTGDGRAAFVENNAAMERMNANLAAFDQQAIDALLFGPKTALSLAAEIPNIGINGYDYLAGNISGRDAVLGSIPGGIIVGKLGKIAAESIPLTGVRANQLAGAGREALVRSELAAKYPGASIVNEAYLRTADGIRAVDPLTGTARRIDTVVIQGGRAIDSIEVTSLTATKRAQILKEMRIRNNGGTFVRDRATGQLIDVGQVPTQIIRKP